LSESAGQSVAASAVKERLPEADVIKAAGIVVIPLIHSLRPLWDASVSGAERWILFATRFAVPGFLFVSGYLGARDSATPSKVGARLRRLLLPYAVATIAAECFFLAHGRPVTAPSVALDLISGSALGPYYYVFVAVLLTLAWPLFSLARRGLLGLLAILSVASQLAVELGLVRLPISWVIRNPFLWCAYYLFGWAVRERRERLLEWLAPRRVHVEVCLSIACATALGAVAFARPGPPIYVVAWIDVYVVILLLFVAATRLRDTPEVVRKLSDASYAVYLYHLLVIYAVWNPDRGAPAAFGAAAAVASWALGIGVPMAGAMVLRRVLGERARVWFGG
jgi:surface polysaccharide O-acyltransferase-like enzyme